MICDNLDGWSACSEKVKREIAAAKTPPEAFVAAQEWAERFEQLRASNSSDRWSASDQERMQEAGERLFDEAIGKYLDPANIALDMALERFLPTVAAVIANATGAWATLFFGLLAPSPTENDFTASLPVNNDINRLLFDKVETLMPFNWRSNYSSMMERAFHETRGDVGPP